jgi:beta-lactamase class C
MRLITSIFMAALCASAAPALAELSDSKIDAIVGGHVREALADGGPNWIGVAVAVRIDGRTLFFNYGYADDGGKRPVTSDTLFNLGSVSKVFDTALLGQASCTANSRSTIRSQSM